MNKLLVVKLAIALALILSACQSAPPPTPDGAAPSGESENGLCGDRAQLANELFVYNWTDYLDSELLDKFESECGVKVSEVYYDSNEALLATLQAGGAAYDVIVPSDYMIQIMISENLLEPLDYNIITNIKNYPDHFRHQYFDPEQKYTVPYFWGTAGLAVDTNVIPDPEPSWGLVFDPASEACGQIGMLDDVRETLGAALIYLGYSVNDVDPAHLEEAKDLLIQQAACVKAYDSNSNDDSLIQGEMEVAHMWTGDAVLAADPASGGREGIVYIIPDEGTTIFQDALAVPTSAPNKYTAMVFINFLADAENAAQNTLVVGYPTTNEAARAFIDPDILNDESAYPPDSVFDRLQPIEDVGDAIELYDRIWTEFKAAIGS